MPAIVFPDNSLGGITRMAQMKMVHAIATALIQ